MGSSTGNPATAAVSLWTQPVMLAAPRTMQGGSLSGGPTAGCTLRGPAAKKKKKKKKKKENHNKKKQKKKKNTQKKKYKKKIKKREKT
eukprot:NODE_23001_length_685_cov_2.388889.p2 GENE.NODE_23001_length_685_cov_2.388889~~NODE_23001_length_685_cov_2.388889.p2  ORF type:complete len:88 (-),score=44.27 NODE_23001_length_685_cov_2.388889:69-332(-)